MTLGGMSKLLFSKQNTNSVKQNANSDKDLKELKIIIQIDIIQKTSQSQISPVFMQYDIQIFNHLQLITRRVKIHIIWHH